MQLPDTTALPLQSQRGGFLRTAFLPELTTQLQSNHCLPEEDDAAATILLRNWMPENRETCG
jgi:hypothetical protein